jgi:EAL domain-containing protein (putative c-di-GMP-specific phosphodiesterase class I)
MAWQAEGLAPIPISVNLSARQFQSGDLSVEIRTILTQSGMPAELLNLELTESITMEDPDHAQQILRQLKDLGVDLSLDDFGTGYSSLIYLCKFPFDHLKIDRTFIRNIDLETSGKALLKGIIDISHTLNLTAVAEGVETQEQLETLIDYGCDILQGYLFSKPLPAEDFARLLRQGTSLAKVLGGGV